jgi:hypothetical protein
MKKIRKRKSAIQKRTASSKATAVLPHRLQEEFLHFIEYHPARRLSTNLRSLLIEFLTYEGATEAEYLQDLLYDLEGLFELLEKVQDELVAID